MLMRIVWQILGGCLGGLVGAGAWAAVHYYSGIQSRFLGLLVPFFAIIGTRAALRDGGESTRSIAAVLATIIGLMAFKTMTVYSALRPTQAMYREFAINSIAEVIVEKFEREGQTIDWPGGERPLIALRKDYPSEIWERAAQQWVSLAANEQADLLQATHLANQDFCIAEIARSVALAGTERYEWPPGRDVYSAWLETHFPNALWQDAMQRWQGLSPQQQIVFRDDIKSHLIQKQENFREIFEKRLPAKLAFSVGVYGFGVYEILSWLAMVGIAYCLAPLFERPFRQRRESQSERACGMSENRDRW